MGKIDESLNKLNKVVCDEITELEIWECDIKYALWLTTYYNVRITVDVKELEGLDHKETTNLVRDRIIRELKREIDRLNRQKGDSNGS